MNRNFAEMLSALSGAGVEFLVVGAHALAAHGLPRATGDLDIWVRPTEENAGRVWKALEEFGASLDGISVADFVEPGTVFQIGIVPARIDVLTELTALSFDAAWPRRVTSVVEGMPLSFLSRDDLIANKRALGRPRDLADVEELERQK
jgi:hypothetical protein